MSAGEVAIRIVLAAVLGGAIGLEREIREHTAGFRTHILVSVGSAAFTLASIYGVRGTTFDPTRIAAQIVTGIGFLGAGAILRYGVTVRGLTTAASLWVVAGVGLAAGQGFYSMALIATGIAIVSLYLLRLVEERVLYRRAGSRIAVRIQFRDSGYAPLSSVMNILDQAHVAVKQFEVVPGDSEHDTVHLSLQLPRGLTPVELTALIGAEGTVRSVSTE